MNQTLWPTLYFYSSPRSAVGRKWIARVCLCFWLCCCCCASAEESIIIQHFQFGTQARKCLQFKWHFNSGPWRQDVLYGPARTWQNFVPCRLRPSQDFQAVGRQPAILRSLEYRTILYKTIFGLDKLWRHVSDKIMNCCTTCKGACNLSTFSMEKLGLGLGVGLANISCT